MQRFWVFSNIMEIHENSVELDRIVADVLTDLFQTFSKHFFKGDLHFACEFTVERRRRVVKERNDVLEVSLIVNDCIDKVLKAFVIKGFFAHELM